MEHLIISHLHQFNQPKKHEIVDYQRVSQCSTMFRAKRWNAGTLFLNNI